MYTKSKDYNTLYNLVKDGKEVIAIRGKEPLRIWQDGSWIRIGNLLLPYPTLPLFLSECTRLNVEWIMPTYSEEQVSALIQETLKSFDLPKNQLPRF